MQISDLISQYHNSLSANSDIQTKTKGVEQLVNTVEKLQKGQIFEGTVTSVKDNQVTLAMSSGENILARIDGNVCLNEGTSVFFQVKSNDGSTIQIRPLMTENGMNNPTLLNALDAAGLTVNERNLSMVNAMMENQMPIDAASLNQMAKTMVENPTQNVATLVSLSKLNRNITPDVIAQFENFKANQGAASDALSKVVDQIPSLFQNKTISSEDVLTFQKTLLHLLSFEDTSQGESIEPENAAVITGEEEGQGQAEMQAVLPVENENIQETAKNDIQMPMMPSNEDKTALENVAANAMKEELPKENAGTQISIVETATAEKTRNASSTEMQNSLGNILTNADVENLKAVLSDGTDAQKQLVEKLDTALSSGKNIPVQKFMQMLTNIWENDPTKASKSIQEFFDTDAAKKILKNLAEQQWRITPQDLKKEDTIPKLYEKMEVQMQQLEEAAKNLTKDPANLFAKTTENVRNNIDFMNQLNQNYSYVQLPLKLANQNANGELFVYTNKKQTGQENGELTAFLHFSMDHLGDTDISVKMKQKNVETKFYMEREDAFVLLSNNVGILQQRLQKKGYTCQIDVLRDEKPANFVKDVMEKDKNTGGTLQRYSFDVRA